MNLAQYRLNRQVLLLEVLQLGVRMPQIAVVYTVQCNPYKYSKPSLVRLVNPDRNIYI
jgi:hypothetical protein